MPGPFDPVPFSTYQGAGAGAAQGLSALAQAFLARKQLGLQKQQFQLQQAEAGYQQPTTETLPGKISAPSMTQIGNVPTATPGVTAMGGTPSGPITRGPDRTINIPGYYDITKSLPYAQAQLNGRLLAAMYGANSRERIEQERYGGGVDENGNPILGSHYYEQQALLNQRGAQQSVRDQYLFGGQGPVDPLTGQPMGARTESALITQAPALQLRSQLGQQSIAQRAQALGETMRHNRATEGAATQRIGIQQQTAAQKLQALQANGLLSPKEASVWSSAYNSANFNGLSPDSAEARANQAVAAFRRSATGSTPPAPVAAPPAPTGPSLMDRIGGLFHHAQSGGATAPAVPRSGTEASSLTTQPVHGLNAPTVLHGNRRVGDSSTGTYPHAANLPPNPSAPTVPTTQPGKQSKAAIDAGYAAAIARGWSPADAAAHRDSLYQANGITP